MAIRISLDESTRSVPRKNTQRQKIALAWNEGDFILRNSDFSPLTKELEACNLNQSSFTVNSQGNRN